MREEETMGRGEEKRGKRKAEEERGGEGILLSFLLS
jgi:hypothetical protein